MKQKTDFLRKTNNTDKPLAKLKKEKKDTSCQVTEMK